MKTIKQKDVNPSPIFCDGEEAELLKFKTCYIAHKIECSKRLVCNANQIFQLYLKSRGNVRLKKLTVPLEINFFYPLRGSLFIQL